MWREGDQAMKRVILELGAGTALHGGQYTKAAVRAAQDALHHSSLSFLKALKIDPKSMQVEVTIGVQRPDKVDPEAVKAAFPHGQITVKVVKGGLDVVNDEDNDDVTAIASAAIAVRVDIPGAKA
jgi:uncharacterized protein (TIGR02058 family)